MTKVLVTGAAGFIGMHVVLRLLRDGFDVVGLDNLNNYYNVDLKLSRLWETGILPDELKDGHVVESRQSAHYRFVKLDITNRAGIQSLFRIEKFDYVIHLAAQAGVRYSLEDPYAYTESNVTGFLSILEACRHHPVKHLVYASTSSVYGLNQQTPFEESHPADHPVSLYAATKKANEMMAHSYSHLFRIPTTGLRFFTVYGPWGRPDMALFLFAEAIMKGEPIQIFNNGAMLRDFTYIDDVVEGIIRCMVVPATPALPSHHAPLGTDESTAPFQVLNIGNAKPVSLMTYIRQIELNLGRKAIRQMMPLQPGDVVNTYADISKLMWKTGYRPQITVEIGVKRFIEWYLRYYREQIRVAS